MTVKVIANVNDSHIEIKSKKYLEIYKLMEIDFNIILEYNIIFGYGESK